MTSKIFAMVSAKRPNVSDAVNASNHELMRNAIINNLHVKPVEATGCWMGETEASMMVELVDIEAARYIVGLARCFAQDGVLIVDADKKAHILYTNDCEGHKRGDTETLGQWEWVGHDAAMRLSGYTEVNGHYFAVV